MMDCGGAEFDYDVLVALQHPGEKVILPFNACLIDTDDGPVQLAKRENATLWPGHEPGCWNKMKRSPDSYR
jgi:hypothetical protein